MSLYGMELVVALVKQKTVKDGGNALALTDHRKPSLLGSSCHHIAGDMLWIGDTANRETGTVAYLSAPVGDKIPPVWLRALKKCPEKVITIQSPTEYLKNRVRQFLIRGFDEL